MKRIYIEYRVSTNQLFEDIDAQQVYHKSPADLVFFNLSSDNLFITWS